MIKMYCQFLPDKVKGEPEAKLRYRVKWDGNIASFSLGYRVELEKWSQETQRCVNSTTHGAKKIPAAVINKVIDNFSRASEKVFATFDAEGQVPSLDEFREAFALAVGKRSIGKKRGSDSGAKGFYEFFDLFIQSNGIKNDWSDATFTKFSAIRGHLMKYNENLTMQGFNDAAFQGFVSYLMRIPMKNTTIDKNIAFVRWFLRWASSNGYYKGKSHETFRVKLKGTDGNLNDLVYLSWDELMNLAYLEIPEKMPGIDRVRDVFCFCCFSSLRYSDVKKLTSTDVKETYMSVVMKKTNALVNIELNKYSRAILDKYKDEVFPDDLALPVISNSKMNEQLKKLGKFAEMNESRRVIYFQGNKRCEEIFYKWELLTTHAGRRTFVIAALTLGIPSEVIMKWTGHSDFKAMKPYFKIVDKLKMQEMDKFNRA